MNKFKIWISSNGGKITLSSIIVFLIMMIPIIILSIALVTKSPTNGTTINAYNRDASSGTREAFEEAINFDSEVDKYSNNVNEVSSNDQMMERVKKDQHGFGYSSYESAIANEEDFTILRFNGIDLTRDNILNGDYDAIRPFNMFFRTPDSLLDEYGYDEVYGKLYDNLYINSNEVNSGNSLNIWDNGFDMSGFNNLEELNDEFYLSWAFYNWVLYSSEAQEEILSLGFNYSNITYDSVNMLDNFLVNTNLSSKEIQLKTIGSTSVLSSLGKLLNDADNGFISIISSIDNTIKINHDSAHLGSGEAFSDNGDSNSYLGFQSRGMKESELTERWIDVNEIGNVLTTNGFYDSTSILREDYFPYATFENDAVAFLINNNLTFTFNDIKMKPIGITAEGVKSIYTNSNTTYEILFTTSQIEISVL